MDAEYLMTRRGATMLGWALFSLSLLLNVLGGVLSEVADDSATFDLAFGVVLLVLPAVGALVVSRRPENAIGWLLLVAGVLLAVSGAAYGYAAVALSEDSTLPAGVAAAWLTSWVFLPALFGIPPLLFLLFPNGRPLSQRWRFVVSLTVLSLVAMSGGGALRPGPLVDSPAAGVENPVGVPGSLASILENLGWTSAFASLLLSTVSLVLRYRRSRGEERLQLRWFAFSATLFLLCFSVSAALFVTPYAAVGQVFVVVGFCTIPMAAGIAILRYRLYDIDLVVNKTLVYGGLTAILVGFYLASVLLLRLALDPLTGQSDLAVAASTLVVAALFRPLRARIQQTVDRRFYRRRYDAVRTLDAFADQLRHEVDLDAVGSDLRTAVSDTMQPAHVTLWLRT